MTDTRSVPAHLDDLGQEIVSVLPYRAAQLTVATDGVVDPEQAFAFPIATAGPYDMAGNAVPQASFLVHDGNDFLLTEPGLYGLFLFGSFVNGGGPSDARAFMSVQAVRAGNYFGVELDAVSLAPDGEAHSSTGVNFCAVTAADLAHVLDAYDESGVRLTASASVDATSTPGAWFSALGTLNIVHFGYAS